MKIKNIVLIVLGIVLGFIAAIIFYLKYPSPKPISINIEQYHDTLESLALLALKNDDVPIASIIILKNKIIGAGYNTVNKDLNPSGHAEINAISNCWKNIGRQNFILMNKDSLFLITTFEPCPICQSVIEEYNIKNTVFILPKKTKAKISHFKKHINHNFYQQGDGRFQYNLFKLHREFDSTFYPY